VVFVGSGIVRWRAISNGVVDVKLCAPLSRDGGLAFLTRLLNGFRRARLRLVSAENVHLELTARVARTGERPLPRDVARAALVHLSPESPDLAKKIVAQLVPEGEH